LVSSTWKEVLSELQQSVPDVYETVRQLRVNGQEATSATHAHIQLDFA
jgi:hypothetical protein